MIIFPFIFPNNVINQNTEDIHSITFKSELHLYAGYASVVNPLVRVLSKKNVHSEPVGQPKSFPTLRRPLIQPPDQWTTRSCASSAPIATAAYYNVWV